VILGIALKRLVPVQVNIVRVRLTVVMIVRSNDIRRTARQTPSIKKAKGSGARYLGACTSSCALFPWLVLDSIQSNDGQTKKDFSCICGLYIAEIKSAYQHISGRKILSRVCITFKGVRIMLFIVDSFLAGVVDLSSLYLNGGTV
jgi:hypothetical protein